jgi:ATP-dependent helicase HrpA
LSNETKLALARSATPVAALVESCAAAAADELIASHGGPPFTEEAFAAMALAARSQLVEQVAQLAASSGRILAEVSRVLAKLDGLARRAQRSLDSAIRDLRRQLEAFSDAAALASMGVARMVDVGRYLAAAERRIDALPADLRRDTERQAVVERVTDRYRLWLAAHGGETASTAGADDPRWMIEEFRVSLWAQGLGTPSPVSEARILRTLEDN